MIMYSVIERLPDGRERVLATGLTLAEVRAYVAPPNSWAIAFVQE
jgi:hypothetical protein